MNKSNYQRSSGASLSAKERRIVELLVAGLSNRAIAKATNRTEATVKYHLKNVFHKLGVNSRVQVILLSVTSSGKPLPHAGARSGVAGESVIISI